MSKITENRLSDLVFVQDGDYLFAFAERDIVNGLNTGQVDAVFSQACINPIYLNLLKAAPILYRMLIDEYNELQIKIDIAEKFNNEKDVPKMLDRQALIKMAQNIAINGPSFYKKV